MTLRRNCCAQSSRSPAAFAAGLQIGRNWALAAMPSAAIPIALMPVMIIVGVMPVHVLAVAMPVAPGIIVKGQAHAGKAHAIFRMPAIALAVAGDISGCGAGHGDGQAGAERASHGDVRQVFLGQLHNSCEDGPDTM